MRPSMIIECGVGATGRSSYMFWKSLFDCSFVTLLCDVPLRGAL